EIDSLETADYLVRGSGARSTHGDLTWVCDVRWILTGRGLRYQTELTCAATACEQVGSGGLAGGIRDYDRARLQRDIRAGRLAGIAAEPACIQCQALQIGTGGSSRAEIDSSVEVDGGLTSQCEPGQLRAQVIQQGTRQVQPGTVGA